MDPELRHLRCFVAVAEELSFSAAAVRIHLTQQSVSRTVAQLEAMLATELFDREGRGVSLTAAGEAMLPVARRSLAAAAEAMESARAAAAPGDRRLRLDVSSGGMETGALLLRALRAEHPEIGIEQTEVGVRRGLQMISDGSLDLLLGLEVECPEEIAVETIRREPVLIGMAADHLLAAEPVVPGTALEGVEILLPADSAAGEWNQFIEDGLRAAGLSPRRFATVTHGSTSAAEVVAEGACLVPTAAWTEPPPSLVFRPLVEPELSFTWAAMWRRGAEQRPQVGAALALLRELREARDWN